MNKKLWLPAALLIFFGVGCAKVEVAPVEIKPIHITVDVNVRIAKELDNFFGDIDNIEPTKSQNQPTTNK